MPCRRRGVRASRAAPPRPPCASTACSSRGRAATARRRPPSRGRWRRRRRWLRRRRGRRVVASGRRPRSRGERVARWTCAATCRSPSCSASTASRAARSQSAERCEQLVRELWLEGAAGGRQTLSRCLSAKAMALYDVDRPQAAPTLQRALEMGRDPAGQISDGALLNVIRVSANPNPHPNPNPNPNQARYSTSPPSSSPCCHPLQRRTGMRRGEASLRSRSRVSKHRRAQATTATRPCGGLGCTRQRRRQGEAQGHRGVVGSGPGGWRRAQTQGAPGMSYEKPVTSFSQVT